MGVRSDIYSLGATLWFLLTGHLPSGASSATSNPLPVEQLKAAQVPSSFVELLSTMLATEPVARPSVRELAKKLDAIQAHMAARRRPMRRLALAAAAVALAAVTAFLFLRPGGTDRSQSIASVSEKSIAVLPFANTSEEKENAFFADGIQDELLTNLARIADLKVVSRTSAMQYRRGGAPRNLREIGRKLGVAFVVEGAVRTVGRQVRISVQLIDARTDLYQWGENYDRPLDDVFAIQSEIAQAVAERLHAEISPPERALLQGQPTHDLEAFNLYSRAKTIFQKALDNLEGCPPLMEVVTLLDEAVARDPNFALAYCELANVHSSLYFQGCDHTPKRLALSEAALNAASNLQPAAGEVHLARALHLFWGYLAYEPALAELAIARRVLPNATSVLIATSDIYRRQGKWEESTRTMEQAVSLDPLNVSFLQFLADGYDSLFRYADEIKMLDRALAIKPDEIALRLSRADLEVKWHADTRPLHDTIADILAKNPSDAGSVASAWLNLSYLERDPVATDRALAALRAYNPNEPAANPLYREGRAALFTGARVKAERLLRAARPEQEKQVAADANSASALSRLGFIDAVLGNKEEAIREGLRAVELCPVTRDQVENGDRVFDLGIIYAWTGELSLACDVLEKSCQSPPYCSHALFRLWPGWDPLRGYPRFEQFVAHLAAAVGEK